MRIYKGQFDKHSGRRQSNDNDRSYNRSDRGGRSDRPEMHDAVCDECGKDCQVPFKPTGGKPIYCSRCFEKHDDNGGRDNRRGGRDSRGGRDNYRREGRPEMHQAICDECGKDCEVPFKPSSDKPIYCSECFETKGGNSPRGGSNNNQMSEKLEELEAKVDKILKILESNNTEEVIEETPEVPEPVEEVQDVKAEETTEEETE